MAADRSTYPSSYPWTNWGLQLERDLATRMNHISEQEKTLESLWEKCLFVCLVTVENLHHILSGQLRII